MITFTKGNTKLLFSIPGIRQRLHIGRFTFSFSHGGSGDVIGQVEHQCRHAKRQRYEGGRQQGSSGQ